MDTLPNSVLSLILEYSSLEDQLINHRLINNRFYHLMPSAVRLQNVDVSVLQAMSSKIPTFSWPKISIAQQMDAVYNLFSYLIDLNGHRIEKITYASEPPMKTEILHLLADCCPEIEALDFSQLSQLSMDKMEILPVFENLRDLRLPKQIGADFAPILAQLRLRTLEIGGENAPLTTGDNGKLRRLVISGVPPRGYIENIHRLGELFPNLRMHDMEKGRENGWRFQIYDQFKAQGDPAIQSYRRLVHLRRSRFIDDDPYLFPRTADYLSLSNFFPNLRRLVISLRDYTAENGDANPPPWTRTVAVLPHLKRLTELRIEGRTDYGPSASFGELLAKSLSLAPHIRKLDLRGRFPSWDKATVDKTFSTIACGNRLQSLTLCGVNVACVLEKLLEHCPNLREIDYTDEVLALFGVDENGIRSTSALANYSRRLQARNRLRRLRLRQTVLGVYIANRIRESVNFMNEKAMLEMGSAGWPNLEELDVRIKDDAHDWIESEADPKISAVSTFFSKMPKLKVLKLELESNATEMDVPSAPGIRQNIEIVRPPSGGLLRKILRHLPLLQELTIAETKIKADLDDWIALCSHNKLRKFSCRLIQESHRNLDEGLRRALGARQKMVEEHGCKPPLLQGFIFDCSNRTRTVDPLVGDALIDAKSRLRIVIPESR